MQDEIANPSYTSSLDKYLKCVTMKLLLIKNNACHKDK